MFPSFAKNRIFITSLFFLFASLLKFPPPWPEPLSTILHFLLFIIGGAIGFFLPETDHLVYTILSHPQDLSSQRLISLIRQKKFSQSLAFLSATTSERARLFFHSFLFQLFFLVLAFWVIASSSSFLGKGLVLSFSFQLFLKQLHQYQTQGNLDSWLWNFKANLPPHRLPLYLVSLFLLQLLFVWWA